MAFPTSVNDQVTDLITLAHTVGGDAALASIVGLLEVIAHGLNESHRSKAASQPRTDIATILSSAFRKAESELQAIRARIEAGA